MKHTQSITPEKTSLIAQIHDLISRSKSIAVVDYKGLKVTQASELRRAIKKAGGEMLITKNTLFRIAATERYTLAADSLSGTSAFIFSLKDEVSAIKAVSEFAQKNTSPTGGPTFKIGLLGKDILSAQQIAELATLPDKPTLVAKMLGSLTSSYYHLVYNLNWNISQLVRTLDAVSKAKGVN